MKRLLGSIAGLIGGGIFGAMRGRHIGIVTRGLGIAGTIPCLIIGGILGLLSGNKVGSKFDNK